MRNRPTDLHLGRLAVLLLGLGALGTLGALLVGSVTRGCGSSMGDAWDTCDWVLLDKVSIGHNLWAAKGSTMWIPGLRALQRGDVVRIWLPYRPEAGRKAVMKRVVGLPGDTIEMVENVLVMNGHPVVEPYFDRAWSARLGWNRGNQEFSWQSKHLVGKDPEDYEPSAATWGPLRVPVGHYFVMSDRRATIGDSRSIGFIARRQIDARAVLQANRTRGIRFFTTGFHLVQCDAGVPADVEQCASDWRAKRKKFARQ